MAFYHSKNYSLQRSIGFLVNTLALELNEDLDAQLKARLDVSLPQWRVLTTLHFNRFDNASALCDDMHYDSGAMTRMLDRLEALALVVRQPDAGDRRAHKLTLTKKGALLCKRGIALARDTLNVVMADLTDDEGEQLISLLQRLKQTRLQVKAIEKLKASR
jgi:DNA-binding MarR family transcriptional regulator